MKSFFCTARFGFAILGLAVCFNLYAQRMAMSVAIVCMVNHTAVAELRRAELHLIAAEDGEGELLSSDNSYASDSDAGVTSATLSAIDGDERQPDPQSRCSAGYGASGGSPNSSTSMDGPFVWPKQVQGHILGSFFYGYLLSQIPSGLLAERFGAKWVLIGFLGASTIGTLLTPIAARVSYELLIVLRVIVGIGSGALFPAMHAMWGQWAPPMERSKLAGISYAGSMMGSVVAMPVSGLLCRYGFDEGWGSVFYTIGLSSVVVLILWAVLITSTPATNKIVSADEKRYILDSLAGEVTDKKASWRDMPWRSIATSGPVWAVIVANFCMDWGAYTLMTNIPTFYKEVLKFDIESNGLYSALPFLGLWISMTVSPVAADYIRSSGLLSTTATRKVFTAIGLFGCSIFLVGLSFLDCTMTGFAVAMLTVAATVNGTSLSGFWVNHMDIAPRYAGTLMGISNGLAAISGFIAPYVAAALTKDQTRESWQIVFSISAALDVFGGVVYCLLGTGVIQPWAVDGDVENGSKSAPAGHVQSSNNDVKIQDSKL